MIKVREKYVIDERGRKTAVVLDVREYRRLMEHLEAMEDALDLDEARRVSSGSRPYEEVRSEFKQRERVGHGVTTNDR